MYEVMENVSDLVVESKEFFERYKEFEKVKARLEMQEKELKAKLLELMEANGIDKFENDYVCITRKAPTLRKVVDTEALKAQGLYESFVKNTTVKASVLIKVK